MLKTIPYLFVLTLVLWASACVAQSPWTKYEQLFQPAKHYLGYRVAEKITIDGKALESSWTKAEWSDDFVDIEGDRMPAPLYQTRMKMLWDQDYLYILAQLEEPNIWAYYDQRDMIVYHENDFEVFVDPNGDGINYFEYEVNARNNLFDLFMSKSYRSGGQALLSYNSLGFESAVSIDGTINNPADTDHHWTVEIKIPFSELAIWGDAVAPADGDQWRINFSRVNWQTEVTNGKYHQKKNPETGKSYPEYNWVWSAPGIISMHAPERYGLLQFSTNTVGEQPVAFSHPQDQQLRDCCWLVFYYQQAYRAENKRFATSLKELNLPVKLERNGRSFQVNLSASPQQFTVFVSDDDGQTYTLNNDGLIQAVNK
ncbi:sugar-binding protein [Mangrovibacterium marinum]|uniref:Carbohydrate binding protein with CBM9 domain n=1 Tax=Mangrovibacterium marinum TaxID=1639118 RepID=A0A2T5BW03_9BACT|nr:sugar-binding protein [Mangrovibacterium marinum]PTN03803.1 carbohydrate binding protein with CBM9 domain [Mangrovibacterium marinum]